MHITRVKRLTVELCRAHPDSIVIFGDNLVRCGRAGQAVVRWEPNAVGIPTKRKPSMNDDAFFSDQADEIAKVLKAIERVRQSGKPVIVPENPPGSGLAQLPKLSPLIYMLICDAFYSSVA